MTFRNHCMRELKILITGLASPAVLLHGKNNYLRIFHVATRYLPTQQIFNQSWGYE
jgi:hypothetical protein